MAILAAVLELVYIYQSKESAENRKESNVSSTTHF